MPYAVGLMSGTSVDGIDAALVKISGRSPHLKIKLVAFETSKFPKKNREAILKISSSEKGTAEDLCALNFELGELFAKAALAVCKKGRVSRSKVAVIGSHGQTVCHLGRKGTLQIGEPSVIAERTGITTVSDFRTADIAAGGLGAPLVPYYHYLQFRHPKKDRVIHNIGGISNLTFLPKGGTLEKVIGFDTGPGNMIIDGVVSELTKGKMRYDRGGKIASRGFVSLKLLKELLAHPFISKKTPKTAGREEFGEKFIKEILRRGWALRLKDQDIIATATAFTAESIAENYRRFIFNKLIPSEIVFGGGGIHNRTLMQMIRAEFPGIKVSTFDDHGVPSDAAEAICFSVLAFETLQGRPTSIPSVTGASRSVVLGKIQKMPQNVIPADFRPTMARSVGRRSTSI